MKTTFTTINGTHFEANETMTHCYCWPKGRKGERTRIKKAQFEQAQREHELEVSLKMDEAMERLVAEEQERTGHITEQELEAKIAETEESETTEEVKRISKKMSKRAKKNAFHHSVAYPGLTLTEKQVDFMLHLPDTYFWEDGLDSIIWTDCLCDDIQGQFAGKPMTVGAMISTLCEKGLGIRATERRNGRKCTSFALTEMGKRVAKELGLA